MTDDTITDPAAYDARRTAAMRAIDRRQGTGRPGDDWLKSEPIGSGTGHPFYEGTHGRARLFVTHDGTAYDVRVFGHNGKQRAARTFRGLDAALRFGQRIADQAHAGDRATVRPDTDPRIAAIVATLTPNMLDGLTSVANVHGGAGTRATHTALIDRGLIVSADVHPYAAATLDGRRVLFAARVPGQVDPDTDPTPVAPVTGDPWADLVTDSTGQPISIGARVMWLDGQGHGTTGRVTGIDPAAFGGRGGCSVTWDGAEPTESSAAERMTVIPETVTSAALDAARRWRSIAADEAFTCTACGGGTVYGGGMQTLDGAQRLCNRCDAARIDAHWHDRAAGATQVRMISADGTSTSGGAFTHQPYPYPADVPPSVQWGLIVSAAADWTRNPIGTRRRIGERVAATLRAVYDIPGADGAGMAAAREADPRSADDRARAYLAAYAATLTGATDVEPVERRALAFVTS